MKPTNTQFILLALGALLITQTACTNGDGQQLGLGNTASASLHDLNDELTTALEKGQSYKANYLLNLQGTDDKKTVALGKAIDAVLNNDSLSSNKKAENLGKALDTVLKNNSLNDRTKNRVLGKALDTVLKNNSLNNHAKNRVLGKAIHSIHGLNSDEKQAALEQVKSAIKNSDLEKATKKKLIDTIDPSASFLRLGQKMAYYFEHKKSIKLWGLMTAIHDCRLPNGAALQILASMLQALRKYEKFDTNLTPQQENYLRWWLEANLNQNHDDLAACRKVLKECGVLINSYETKESGKIKARRLDTIKFK